MMKFQRLLYRFFIFIFSICYFIYCCQANKVSVGGQDGWVLKPSETYDQWSGRNRFQVNDSIVFKYKKGSDSVLVVNEDDYNSCNTKNPIKKMEDGNSEFKFDRSGPFYFISGINDHCAKGQKLLVKVLAVRKSIQPNPPPIPTAPVPQAQPPIANPPKGFEPISPYPKSPSPSISKAPVPQAQPPTANPPKGLGPISPSPKSQAPSPLEMSPISPSSSSPSPSPYAVSPPSPPNSPVPAAAPAPGTSASSPPSPGVMSPTPSGGGSSSSSPPSPGPAPSGGGSSTNSSSSPQAQNQKSYAMTVTPSSFLVLSVALLVTIVLSGEFLGGGI